jgi:tRNA(Ile)-lysidine synthetase-like protein
MKMSVNWPKAGRYVLAVSGGADSMVLLQLFARQGQARGYDLIVAHFDHGLRDESVSDRKFVQDSAIKLGLPFEYMEAKLPDRSEATARDARHEWLESLRQKQDANAVITAHHADDLLETSILNLARGTGRRGLAPMQDGPIIRPLIGATRADLRLYAKEHQVAWQEDGSNADISNPRNFLRLKLLPKATRQWTSSYLEGLHKVAKLNTLIDQSISEILDAAKDGENAYNFARQTIQELSISELEEVIIAAAQALKPGTEVERRVVQELALFAKTSSPHRHRPLRSGIDVSVFMDAVRINA